VLVDPPVALVSPALVVVKVSPADVVVSPVLSLLAVEVPSVLSVPVAAPPPPSSRHPIPTTAKQPTATRIIHDAPDMPPP
jgi:hypothetical protein